MVGFLAVNKPSGVSSAKLLNRIKAVVKSISKTDAIGHMGTLDPLASGVLVVAIGKATRLFNYFLAKEKTYQTIFTFGLETDTLDLDGKIVKTSDNLPCTSEILAKLQDFTGKQKQIPPSFSAVKIGGRPAYDLARENKDVKLSSKDIEVFGFKLLRQIDKSRFLFEIVCSSGTYVRSLARDLAHALNTVAIASDIKRIACGSFKIDNCITHDDITVDSIRNNLVSPIDALPWISTVKISNTEFQDLLNGKIITRDLDNNNYFVINENNDIMLTTVVHNEMKILVNLKG